MEAQLKVTVYSPSTFEIKDSHIWVSVMGQKTFELLQTVLLLKSWQALQVSADALWKDTAKTAEIVIKNLIKLGFSMFSSRLEFQDWMEILSQHWNLRMGTFEVHDFGWKSWPSQQHNYNSLKQVCSIFYYFSLYFRKSLFVYKEFSVGNV